MFSVGDEQGYHFVLVHCTTTYNKLAMDISQTLTSGLQLFLGTCMATNTEQAL